MNENFNSAFYKKILDQINSNIYVTDVETDEIVYMNDYMKNTFQVSNTEGKKCWQILQSGMNKRCEFCKIKQLLCALRSTLIRRSNIPSTVGI